MRFLKWYVVVLVVMVQAIAGCGGGGGSSGGGGTVLITSSINTAVSVPTAVSTISISGVSSPLVCGIDLRLTYPLGTTYVNGITSGVTPVGALLQTTIIGLQTADITIFGVNGFGSGEIAKINYATVPPDSLSTHFGVSILRVFDCSGNQIQ